MNLLQDVINYVRRLVKTANNSQLSDSLIIDYINRFMVLDMDARIQLFDFKTKYEFSTVPGVTSYNMPYYGIGSFKQQVEEGGPTIGYYPVYQGFMDPAYVNGIQIPFYNQQDAFYKVWTPYIQTLNSAAIGDGGATYTLQLPFFPAIRGHVDPTGIIASGATIDPIVGSQLGYQGNTPLPNGNPPLTSVYTGVVINAPNAANQLMVVTDSGQFSSNDINVGWLQTNPLGSSVIQAAGSVNYNTGAVTVTFAENVPLGSSIQANCYFYEPGICRAVLYYNNIITVQPPPNIPYQIQMDAYLSPTAFLNSASALPFGYMSEYIARGAARKILSDLGDLEQFNFYEPFFKEQETLVWKRSQRQFTATRTGTIFSDLQSQNTTNSYGIGAI